MSARSWMPLYWKDLIADTVDLTPAEMGAYVRLLGRYWNSGEALLSDDARLARIAGMDADEWAAARHALVDLFEERDGRWFHGRVESELLEAKEKYERRRAAGRKGGRPVKESNAKAKLSECESQGKAGPNQPQPQPHSPIGEDSSLRSESRAPALLDCDPAEPDEVVQAVADWNDLADALNLPKVQKLNAQRKARLKARLREAGGIEGWRHAIGKIRGSPFLRGERSRFRASFDFLLQEQSFTRLMEGNYDDRDPAQHDTTAERRSDIAELIGERYPEYRRAS